LDGLSPIGDASQAAPVPWADVDGVHVGYGVQGRVVKSDLSPVPLPNGKGCLLEEINVLREAHKGKIF